MSISFDFLHFFLFLSSFCWYFGAISNLLTLADTQNGIQHSPKHLSPFRAISIIFYGFSMGFSHVSRITNADRRIEINGTQSEFTPKPKKKSNQCQSCIGRKLLCYAHSMFSIELTKSKMHFILCGSTSITTTWDLEWICLKLNWNTNTFLLLLWLVNNLSTEFVDLPNRLNHGAWSSTTERQGTAIFGFWEKQQKKNEKKIGKK